MQASLSLPLLPQKINMSEERSLNFIEEIIEADLSAGKHTKIRTRFPPEPNGYLHLGHASSICLNFGVAAKYHGVTNLRFDDTNPATEETEYVESIKNDVRWLGFNWDEERYASDYFGQLFEYAITLIKKGKAYVDDSTSADIAAQKGTPTTSGVRNEFANRTVEENLELFEAMRRGIYPDGAKVLRAKIDMTSSNMLMRDPIIYRIKHAHHHRTGDAWCIYPMYDFAHGQSDSIEGITHSICTMEFVPHREVYEWLIEALEIFPSRQYEFARRNISYTVMSKRKLLQLVNEKYVSGWNDPRMPTISGIRRRGFTAASVRAFCDRIGIGKRDNMVDIGLLEFFVRAELNKTALRRMVVFDAIKVIITNLEADEIVLSSEDNPEDAATTHRQLAFTKELWIERDDFMEQPPKKYFRLSPGQMVRLKSAFIIKCDDVIKDSNGNITTLHCTYFPESKSGADTSGLQVKATLHWVSAAHAMPVEIRLYDRLFTVPSVDDADGDFKDYINTKSLEIIPAAYAESALSEAQPGEAFQFLRKGYFCLDEDSTAHKLIFNRTVTLKDNWAKEQQK